jgi:hypothetical protein
MAITTSNSISVNPRRTLGLIEISDRKIKRKQDKIARFAALRPGGP